MPRSRFDAQLDALNDELILMGSLCESAIAAAAKALTGGDKTLVTTVSEMEEAIDQKERDIESLCMKLLLSQQPVARDLRQISAALKMITDMERIGDQALDIAEIVNTEGVTASDETLHICEMSRAVIKMVTDSVDAYVKRDIELAYQVIDYDDIVDSLFCQVKETLEERFKNSSDMEFALDALMIAKYFERIGDHAVNIAEWVLYSVTGSREHRS